MNFFESNQQAQSLAQAALAIMAEVGVPPTPRNYTVWYAYCSNQFPNLNRVVDGMLRETKALTPAQNEEIYDLFFDLDQTGDAIRETSRKIQNAVEQVLEFLSETGEETAHYGQALQDFTGRLAGSTKAEDIRGLIDGILAETRSIETHSRTVEERLRSATTEIDTLKQNMEAIRAEAMTDGLTGIANRKSFDIMLREAADEAMNEETPLALLLGDIDHFKAFNDTWGHQLGDQVLRLVARTLVECIKGRDLAARYGGEEFAVVLPNTRLEDAVTLANNICRTLATKKVVKRTTGEDLGTVTISMGAAAYRPGEPLAELVQRADGALYAAKHAGRNRVEPESDPSLAAAGD